MNQGKMSAEDAEVWKSLIAFVNEMAIRQRALEAVVRGHGATEAEINAAVAVARDQFFAPAPLDLSPGSFSQLLTTALKELRK